MGNDPQSTQRQKRASKAQRAAAREAASHLLPEAARNLLDTAPTTQVQYRTAPNAQQAAYDALIALTSDNSEGVLKICPTEDWKVCYYYWRWSRGTYSGHYVCVMGDVYSVGVLLSELLRKRTEVLQGTRRPTRDKWG